MSQNKVPGPLLSFDPPTSTTQSSSNGLVGGAAINPASVASEQQQKTASRNMQQQRPRPLINFSNNNDASMQRDMMVLRSDDTESCLSETDNEPIIARSAMRQPISRIATTPAEILNISVMNGRKSVTPPPTTTSSVNHIKSSPPASSLATNNNAATNLMDRMKERHRQEVRRSLNNSPFLDNQTSPRKNLSSPSMPLIFSNDEYSPQKNNNVQVGVSTRPPINPLVQSQSFTSHVKSSVIPVNKRASGHLVRSVSVANDIYGNTNVNYGSMPIQVCFYFIYTL